jgi:hypothetical protein
MNLTTLALLGCLTFQDPAPRPVMGEFMGINGHTIQFKPDLYSKVCRKVRDYHPIDWDLGKDSDFVTPFPFARNRVQWESQVYGPWKKHGFESDVSVMFDTYPPETWKNLDKDPYAYAVAFAKAFGPTSGKNLVASVEIGNEPGKYPDDKYRALFEAMAKGYRDGDPKLKVLTCNITTGKSGGYEKSVTCVKGLEALYDVLNIHTYAMVNGWPEWKRSYPEDPAITFLKGIEDLIVWRNENAKGKEIWITEFGWDASSKPNPTTGDAAKWKGNVTDVQQARYIVRSFLVFSAMDVARAYLYFFNDSDEPSFHAASGITRNFQPKPSFHAMAHLYRSLHEYRLARVVTKKAGELYCYEYVHHADPRKKVIAAWSPTGAERTATAEFPLGTSRLARAERMALAEGGVPAVDVPVKAGVATAPIDESPLFLWLEE